MRNRNGKKDAVKKNMDKFHRPSTHQGKTKYNRKNRNLILEMKVSTMNSIPFHEPIPEEIKKQYNL